MFHVPEVVGDGDLPLERRALVYKQAHEKIVELARPDANEREEDNQLHAHIHNDVARQLEVACDQPELGKQVHQAVDKEDQDETER
eukprot:CAMPEP_0176016216 /NCGR_PEP_ID=MMETSP0120_2-20121206/7735_1 /TAXON_ID=160619 /ORGANISM="Kryptoperidinium foliaceum, Strain CCMP 1326" /LENGTH=85 /DNA_ID=CAMNT_0017349203 /DNA_START=162 /DNA_END=419 /DNA_ORIENTATION=+